MEFAHVVHDMHPFQGADMPIEDLTLKQLKEKKEETERKIRDLIQNEMRSFFEETGFLIKRITIEILTHSHVEAGSGRKIIDKAIITDVMAVIEHGLDYE